MAAGTHAPAPRTPTGPVRIRPARPSDLPGILDCLAAAFRPYRRRYTARAYAATVLTEASARRRLGAMRVLVAVDAVGTIVGTVAVKLVTPGHAHLRGMAVRPERQGSGVASRLLGRALRVARDGRRTTVTLETTEPLRRAARFYVQRGFRRTGRTRRWGGMTLLEFELRQAERRSERAPKVASIPARPPRPRRRRFGPR